jgi:hypothetical protein
MSRDQRELQRDQVINHLGLTVNGKASSMFFFYNNLNLSLLHVLKTTSRLRKFETL